MAVAAATIIAPVAMMVGCGDNYRPVVSAIGIVGPAAQAAKYAVAISSPSATQNGLLTLVDFSGDTVLVTASLGVNPYYLALNSNGTMGFTLNSDSTVNSFDISTSLITSDVMESTLLAGSQPANIFPASSTSDYIVDPGVNAVDLMYGTPPALKQEFPITSGYSPVYVVGQAGASRDFIISQAANGGAGTASTIETNLNSTDATLTVGRGPVYGVMSVDGRRSFILNQADNSVSVINTQTNALDQFKNSLAVFNITGFSISNNVATITATNSLTVGQQVTIAGLTAGTYLNNQTLTVLSASSTQFTAAFTNANVASTTDSGTATLLTSTIPVGTRPAWADLASGLNELVVVNQGPVFGITGYSISSSVITVATAPQNLVAGQQVTLSGFPTSTFLNGQKVTVSATGLATNSFTATLAHSNVVATTEAGAGFTGDGTIVGGSGGTVSLVNIPLCTVTALQSDSACDANDPIDASTFGQVLTTIPVGVNPVMVSVLSDFSRAYVINAGIPGLPCAAANAAGKVVPVAGVSTTCTVSVVNLTTDTVTATIPINGHPAWIATADATPTGKAYVVCKDSQVMTVVETDTDTLDLTIPLQGYGVSVVMTSR